MNLLNFMSNFADEESCVTYLKEQRERRGVVCKHCGCTEHRWDSHKRCFECRNRIVAWPAVCSRWRAPISPSPGIRVRARVWMVSSAFIPLRMGRTLRRRGDRYPTVRLSD